MKIKLITVGLLLAAIRFSAQNTSYDANSSSTPISTGSSFNVGLGPNVMSSPFMVGQYNTGIGYESLMNNYGGKSNVALGYQTMFNNTLGLSNVAIGHTALFTGSQTNYNTAIGTMALYNNMVDNNTAVGSHALYSNDYGVNNAVLGAFSLFNNTSGTDNIAFGGSVLHENVSGVANIGIGSQALFNTLSSDNIGIGREAVHENINGWGNIGIGTEALKNTTDGPSFPGHENVAIGLTTMHENTYGLKNAAVGAYAMFYNTTGGWNAAVGHSALMGNTTGGSNTAMGSYALFVNGTANGNTATGYEALKVNTGDMNTAAGLDAMVNNTSGHLNTSNGALSLYNNTTGQGNTGEGFSALHENKKGQFNTAVGFNALYTNDGTGITGSNNTSLGAYSDVSTTGFSNAMALGYQAIVNANNKTRIGNTSMGVTECQSGIYTVSDGRFKNNISEADVKGLDFIKRLRPVVYNFDSKAFTDFLTKNMPDSIRKIYQSEDFSKVNAERHTGFIAQEVEKAAADAGYKFSGVHTPVNENDNYSIAYDQLVVPLVKAVQEQQTIIDQQKSDSQQQIQDLQSQIETLKQQLASQNVNTATGIDASNPGANGFSMLQNEPNPFSHETVIKYTLPQTIATANLVVYDLTGKQITSFPVTEKGTASMTITSEKLSAGIYIYSLVADGKVVDSKRMIVAEK